MLFDILLSLALLLSILSGIFRGALREVLSLATVAAAVTFCQPLGEALMPLAASAMPNVSALSVHAAATIAAGLLVLLVGTATTTLVVRLARRKGQTFTTPDRVVGGALGGCRAISLWCVVACLAPAPTAPAAPTWLGRQLRASVLLTTANRANPLLRLREVRDIRTVEALLRDRARQRAFFVLPETAAFLRHPRVAQAVQDANLGPAIARADVPALVTSPAFQAALLEPGVLPAFRAALAADRQRH